MAPRSPDLTLRIEGQELKRRFHIVNFRMATLYTLGPLEMNQLFSPHKHEPVYSGMSPYSLHKEGKLVAATGKREAVRSLMTAGVSSE